MERIPLLVKELRKESAAVSTKSLMRLDRSDRMIIARRLEDLINDIIRIQEVGRARCTVVLELYEHMGGEVRTSSAARGEKL